MVFQTWHDANDVSYEYWSNLVCHGSGSSDGDLLGTAGHGQSATGKSNAAGVTGIFRVQYTQNFLLKLLVSGLD